MKFYKFQYKLQVVQRVLKIQEALRSNKLHTKSCAFRKLFKCSLAN